MNIPNWKTLLHIAVTAALAVCLIALTTNHYNIKACIIESSYYKKMLSMVTRVEQVEIMVYQEPEPINPQVRLLADYMRSRNSQLSREITVLIASEIVKVAEENNVPLPLLVGLVEKESIFNPMASATIPGSKTDRARGLTQIYQGEGIEIEQNKAHDLNYNLTIGCKILNRKIELNHGNLENALANYSGNATGYSTSVLENVGRFTIYTLKKKKAEEIAKL